MRERVLSFQRLKLSQFINFLHAGREKLYLYVKVHVDKARTLVGLRRATYDTSEIRRGTTQPNMPYTKANNKKTVEQYDEKMLILKTFIKIISILMFSK